MHYPFAAFGLMLSLLMTPACTNLAGASERHNYSEYYPKALGGTPASAYYQNPAQIELLEAAEEGDAAAMQAAVDAGADVNAVGQDGLLPLYWVMAQGSLKGTQWLLDHGADPSRYSAMPADWRAKRQSPLSLAVRLEQPEFLDALLEHGGDPNQTPYEDGRSLLFQTVVPGLSGNAKALIAHGADVNFQVKGYTPFLKTITSNRYDMSLHMLKAGADPTIEIGSGKNAIDAIRQFGNVAIYKSPAAAYPVLIAELQERGLIPKRFKYDPNNPQKTW